MKRSWKSLGAAAVLTLVGVGCTPGPAAVGESSQAIAMSSLPPNLPGCQEVKVSSRVTVRRIDGVRDLFVAYSGDTPICIDSGEDISIEFSSVGWASADGDSNPMPGEPVPPGGSNPMPGNPEPASVGTVSSNPMPGTDPAQSNPMPGQANYGQQGYTTGH